MRTNLVLAAAIIALGLFIWLMLEPQETAAGVPLFGANETVSRIEIFHEGELRFALERHAGAWNVIAPFSLPADEFQVNALLDALHQPAARRYSITEVDPEAIGLADPEWTMRINDMELALGGTTAVGHRRYLQKNGYVYLVPDLLSYRLQRPPLDYASRRLLPRDATPQAIELPTGQRIEKSGTGWSVTPENKNVSADALQALVNAWKNATAMTVGHASSVPRDGEVLLEFSNGDTLRFGIERRDANLLLSRAEPPVTYTLPIDAATELLQLDAGHADHGETPE